MIYPPLDHYQTLAGSQTKGMVLAECFARPTNLIQLGNLQRALLIHSYQCKHDFEMPDIVIHERHWCYQSRINCSNFIFFSIATHFAIKFSDPVLSFISSKKGIRTLFPLLKKDV